MVEANAGDRRAQLLEAHGFNLLAQSEAMLRLVREYQASVRRLRAVPAPSPSAQPAVRDLAGIVSRLQETCANIRDTLDESGALVDADESAGCV
jgi:hypothetical protein